MMKRFIARWVIQMAVMLCAVAALANTRVAIGTFGLKGQRDGDLADLVAVKLSGTGGMELVERRELEAALKEASLSIAGVARAKDAVRFGALVRADQFVLGSCAPINGTNRLVVRLVDAHTGEMRAITVFNDTGSLENLAGAVAEFVRVESPRRLAGHRDYLAIGVVQNLGVNNRFMDFPAQMRGNLAAKLKVTVLERDVISLLAEEVRLDLAGLTQPNGRTNGNAATQMQFAFWIVDGFYQSYEVAEPEVEVKVRIERVSGKRYGFTATGKPDDVFFTKICAGIVEVFDKPAPATPTREGEVKALEVRGRQLADYAPTYNVLARTLRLRSAENPDRIVSALEEATKVFESILLLDPDNNAAKMRLAACLLFETEKWGAKKRGDLAERRERASHCYAEVGATEDPEYADDALALLAETRGGLEGVEMLRRFADEAKTPKAKTKFRYYRSNVLRQLEYDLPIQTTLPYLRQQLVDELTDLQASPKDPVIVDLDEVLFAYRFAPTKREMIINALLPEMVEKFPDLKPYLLLAAAGEQTTTDSTVTGQLMASLKSCEEHPETVWHSASYFIHLSSTKEDEGDVRSHGGNTLCMRTYNNKQYATIVAESLARKRAAERGVAPPLTDEGKYFLAESYRALQQWREALDIFTQVPDASPQEMNECRGHLGLPKESEEIADSVWKNETDINKVDVAYQCAGHEQWATAAKIMESMGHRTVRMNCGGPWGTAFEPVLPAVAADKFRAKAGLPAVKDPMRFELGETPYVGFTRGARRLFSFEVENGDLWIGAYDQFKMFRGEGPFAAIKPTELHQFARTTKTMNTCMCIGSNYMWSGTFDDGLWEWNRQTGEIRHLTMADGLVLNGITKLYLQGQTLWIAYRNGQNGAVGTLDLASHKFSTLTPKLSQFTGMNSQSAYNQSWLEENEKAPQLPVACLTEASPGEMWLVVENKGVQRFHNASKTWDTVMAAHDFYFPAIAADARQGLVLFTAQEQDVLSGEKSGSGGLIIHDTRTDKTQTLRIGDGLPSNQVTAVAVDGRMAWAGGRGFVAVVDLQERKVVKVAYISASQILRIQLDKDHAWVQVSCDQSQQDSAYAGGAWTGVYRVDRAAVEPVVYMTSGE